MSSHNINFTDPDPGPGQWGWIEEFGRRLAEKRNHAIYEAMLNATANNQSGQGITDESLISIGFSRIDESCSETLTVWAARTKPDEFQASGVKYKEQRYLWVYNDTGFFTLHVSRKEETADRYSSTQICVLRDVEHLRRLVSELILDWRS